MAAMTSRNTASASLLGASLPPSTPVSGSVKIEEAVLAAHTYAKNRQSTREILTNFPPGFSPTDLCLARDCKCMNCRCKNAATSSRMACPSNSTGLKSTSTLSSNSSHHLANGAVRPSIHLSDLDISHAGSHHSALLKDNHRRATQISISTATGTESDMEAANPSPPYPDSTESLPRQPAGLRPINTITTHSSSSPRSRFTIMSEIRQTLSAWEQAVIVMSIIVAVCTMSVVFAILKTSSRGKKDLQKKIFMGGILICTLCSCIGMSVARRNLGEVLFAMTMVLVLGLFLNPYLDVLSA